MTNAVFGITKGLQKLKVTPYHKRKCSCPFCGRSVVAHKLARHQQSARCQLAQLKRRVHGFSTPTGVRVSRRPAKPNAVRLE